MGRKQVTVQTQPGLSSYEWNEGSQILKDGLTHAFRMTRATPFIHSNDTNVMVIHSNNTKWEVNNEIQLNIRPQNTGYW